MSAQLKVFIDDSGRFYKATAPVEKSHAHRPLVTQEFLLALPDDGTSMDMVDIDARIKEILSSHSVGGKDNVEDTEPFGE